jgi:hypothetical protein
MLPGVAPNSEQIDGVQLEQAPKAGPVAQNQDKGSAVLYVVGCFEGESMRRTRVEPN